MKTKQGKRNKFKLFPVFAIALMVVFVFSTRFFATNNNADEGMFFYLSEGETSFSYNLNVPAVTGDILEVYVKDNNTLVHKNSIPLQHGSSSAEVPVLDGYSTFYLLLNTSSQLDAQKVAEAKQLSENAEKLVLEYGEEQLTINIVNVVYDYNAPEISVDRIYFADSSNVEYAPETAADIDASGYYVVSFLIKDDVKLKEETINVVLRPLGSEFEQIVLPAQEVIKDEDSKDIYVAKFRVSDIMVEFSAKGFIFGDKSSLQNMLIHAQVEDMAGNEFSADYAHADFVEDISNEDFTVLEQQLVNKEEYMEEVEKLDYADSVTGPDNFNATLYKNDDNQGDDDDDDSSAANSGDNGSAANSGDNSSVANNGGQDPDIDSSGETSQESSSTEDELIISNLQIHVDKTNIDVATSGDSIELKFICNKQLDKNAMIPSTDGNLLPKNYWFYEKQQADGTFMYAMYYHIWGTEIFDNDEVYLYLKMVEKDATSTSATDVPVYSITKDTYIAQGVRPVLYVRSAGNATINYATVVGAAPVQTAMRRDILEVRVSFARPVGYWELTGNYSFSINDVVLSVASDHVAVKESESGSNGRFKEWTFFVQLPQEELFDDLDDYTLPIKFDCTLHMLNGGFALESFHTADMVNGGWHPSAAKAEIVYCASIKVMSVGLIAQIGNSKLEPLYSKEDNAWDVANGHLVEISVQLTRPAELTSFRVGDAAYTDIGAISSHSDDKMYWVISFFVDEAMLRFGHGGTIDFGFEFSDVANGDMAVFNSSVDAEKFKVAGIRYFKPVALLKSEIYSSSAYAVGAKSGDTVTLSFVLDRATAGLNILDVFVGGDRIRTEQTDLGDGTFRFYYVINIEPGKFTCSEVIPFSARIVDKMGNVISLSHDGFISENKNVVRFYDQLTIDNISFSSSNEANALKYAKAGDRVFVSFETSHDLYARKVTIGGFEAEVVDSILDKNKGVFAWTYAISGISEKFADMAYMGFDIEISDPAAARIIVNAKADGATGLLNVSIQDEKLPETITEDKVGSTSGHVVKILNSNAIQYFAPIEALGNMFSNNAKSQYAKNGDTVSVSVTANHAVLASSAIVQGVSFDPVSDFAAGLQVSYTFDRNERNVPEGGVSAEVYLKDKAGNTAILTTKNQADAYAITGRVTYDRTAPTVKLAPNLDAFTNEDISFKIYVEDKNLDMGNVSIRLNGKETLTADDIEADGLTAFDKEIVISKEGTYSIKGHAQDMAGNVSDISLSTKIILDKTLPQIKFLFDGEDGEKMNNVFASGVCINDIIVIEDDYIDEVVCNVSDSGGLYDVDFYTPITGDGKKTVSVYARDLAGNVSAVFSFDFFIDEKAPVPVIVSADGIELQPGMKDSVVVTANKLDVSLKEVWVGNQDADQFTTLLLTDANGKVIKNLLLETQGDSDNFVLSFSEQGDYILVVSAVDSVGNQMVEQSYYFTYAATSFLQTQTGNSAALFVVLSVGSVALITVAAIGTIRARKRVKIQAE